MNTASCSTQQAPAQQGNTPLHRRITHGGLEPFRHAAAPVAAQQACGGLQTPLQVARTEDRVALKTVRQRDP
jgi:hypothetical protein